MPMIKGKHMEPADAAKRGLCPETGIDLNGVDIEDHIRSLWPGARSPEAVERIAMLRNYAKQSKLPLLPVE